MENNKRNTLLLTVIAIATLLVAVVGATFAYFSAQVSTGTSETVQVQTHTNNTLVYDIDQAISITATSENHGQGAGDKTDTATGTVTYKSSNSASSDVCYTLTLDITGNNFTYSTGETATPELLLSATKDSTAIFTNENITTTTTDIQFPTAANGNTYKHTITAAAAATETDVWVVTVTFKNLATDQSDPTNANNNAEKNFNGSLVFTTVDCTTGDPISSGS